MDTRVAPVIDTNPWSSTSPGFNIIPNSESFESVPFVANFDFNFPPPDIITTIATSLSNDLLEPSVDQNNSEVFSNVSNVETNSNLDDVPKDISRQPDVPEPIDNSLLDKLQSQKEWIANAVERLQINDDHVQEETRVDAAGGVQPEDEQSSKSAEEDGKRADVELLKKILTIPEEIDDNYRYISPQGLIKEVISNSEGIQVEEGNGDSSVNDNLPNVYTSMVPTESTHLVKNSLEECPSPSPVVTSTNGPV